MYVTFARLIALSIDEYYVTNESNKCHLYAFMLDVQMSRSDSVGKHDGQWLRKANLKI